MPTAWAAMPGPAAVERPHRDVEAVALLAEPVRRRDAHAVEGELGGRAAADAHLVLEPADREAVGRDLDDERATGAGGAGASGSVTAKTTTRSATEPWLMNRFDAVDDVVVAVADGAVVRAAAASEPASASVRANAMRCSPLASFGNQRACCSAVPASVIGSEPSSWTARMSPVVAHARLSCSTARQTSAARRRARRARPGTAGPGCRGRRAGAAGPRGTRRSGRSRRPGARPARRPARGRRRGASRARR